MLSPEILLGTRLVIHLATVGLLCCYFQPQARFRLGPSVMAGLLLSSSAAMAVQILVKWHELVLHDPQPQLVVFVFTVFLPIAWARGNMAKLYDAMGHIGRLLPKSKSKRDIR